MPSRADRLCWLLGLVLVVGAGCGTRYARTPLVEDDFAKVTLRAVLEEGAPRPRGFGHPATVSGVRLAHVLAQIDVRIGGDADETSERRGAIPTELVYPLGALLSDALAKADPTQEVVIEALRSERTLGLFTQTYATSLVAFVASDGRLQLHLSRLDWPVPKGGEDEPREPVPGREVMAFRVLASKGVEPIGRQAVAVDWRDARFRNPTSVRVGPGGKVSRRKVLMESEEPAAAEPAGGTELPTDPASLRALADLEEARRAGQISEAEYQRRRRELLQPAAD